MLFNANVMQFICGICLPEMLNSISYVYRLISNVTALC